MRSALGLFLGVPITFCLMIINFLVGDSAASMTSYAWRLWWHRTSFYLTPRYAPMSGVKVSLHGPDEEHETSGFRVGIDREAMQRAQREGAVAHSPRGGVWFSGREMVPGVRHVITLRWTPGLFNRGRPSGPNPGELRTGSLGHILPVPSPGYATDLDLYICNGQPWWRGEHQARADNACLGPLRNDADQYLTGVVVRRSQRLKPTPAECKLPSPLSRGDRVRAIGTTVDQEGVLFIVEQWASIKWLQRGRVMTSSVRRAGERVIPQM